MTVSDEMLSAYADDALSGEELRLVEAALKARPELRAQVERQRTLRRQLGAALAPILSEQVPGHLLRTLADTPVSWRWRLGHAWRGAARRHVLLRSGVPIAAALACALVVAIVVVPRGNDTVPDGKRIAFGPTQAALTEAILAGQVARGPEGRLIARGGLARTLDKQLASQQFAQAEVRVGVSFRDKQGAYCRTFVSGNALAGVACRNADSWAIASLAATTSEGRGSYQMAGSTMPASIRRAVATMISGDPLDAAAEMRAREAGWR